MLELKKDVGLFELMDDIKYYVNNRFISDLYNEITEEELLQIIDIVSEYLVTDSYIDFLDVLRFSSELMDEQDYNEYLEGFDNEDTKEEIQDNTTQINDNLYLVIGEY